MTMTFKSAVLAVAAFGYASAGFAQSGDMSSADAEARQTVVQSIQITNVSNLEFGSATAGAEAKTIDPGTEENGDNASFNVTGQMDTAFSIALPSAPITMMVNGGGPNREISVHDFHAYPSDTAGVLDNTGAQLLLVGATRDALGEMQEAGYYVGTFTVTVAY